MSAVATSGGTPKRKFSRRYLMSLWMADHPFLTAIGAIFGGVIGIFVLIQMFGLISDLLRPAQGKLVAQAKVEKNHRLSANRMMTVVLVRIHDADNHRPLTNIHATFQINGQTTRVTKVTGKAFPPGDRAFTSAASMNFYDVKPGETNRATITFTHGLSKRSVPATADVTVSFISQRSTLPSPNLGSLHFRTHRGSSPKAEDFKNGEHSTP